MNPGVILGAAIVGAGAGYLYERHKCHKRCTCATRTAGTQYAPTGLIAYTPTVAAVPPVAAAAAAAAAAPAFRW